MGDVVSLQSMGFGGVSGFQRRHCRQGCAGIMGEHGSGIARDFNVRAGEKKRVALSVSNFAGDAKDATLRVSLVTCRGVNDFNAEAQGGRERGECTGCVWSDERKVTDVKNGELAALGEFEVAITAAEMPVKYLLRALFFGGAVRAENEWEVYAFPEAAVIDAPLLSAEANKNKALNQNDPAAAKPKRDDFIKAVGGFPIMEEGAEAYSEPKCLC